MLISVHKIRDNLGIFCDVRYRGHSSWNEKASIINPPKSGL